MTMTAAEHRRYADPQQMRHEAPEIGAMVRRMVRTLVRRASHGELEALEALVELEAQLPTAVSTALAMMQAGTDFTPQSYGELAAYVGTSRQAVRQRASRVRADDDVAAYYSDGASRSLDWRRDELPW